MPSLILYPADLGRPLVVPLNRRVLRLGSDSDSDVVLAGHDVMADHAHVLSDRGAVTLSASAPSASFIIYGKQKKNHKLADGDVFQIGDHLLRFTERDVAAPVEPRAPSTPFAAAADAFTALHRFAEKLMAITRIDALLDALLDELIALTGADKAFLLVTVDGHAQVHVGRHAGETALLATEEAVSDAIVARVLASGEPLIVADASSDAAFRSSQSVMRLRLSSVLCVPLKARGQTLGLIYLGNDRAINHFDPELLDTVRVFAAEAGLILDGALARRDLELRLDTLQHERAEWRFGELIGACDAMREIYKKISKIATTDISVLIEGETGTGKELVARAIHQRSNRAAGPFVVINCGAIPENLMESELFGHVRGAFTGAIATVKGRFQAAHGGTLFLDEIGEMPLSLQVKILRVIQERIVQRVGDARGEPVDIRFLAATNRRLADEVKAGTFREDLFYRLNVVNLELPPLRERGDDILAIARFLLARWGPELVGREVVLSREAARALLRWRWPGNIRELDNRLKKAVIFCDGGVITPADLDLADSALERILTLAEAREEWQRDYINHVLALNDGNRTHAARDLDVDPRTIFRHLERERGGE